MQRRYFCFAASALSLAPFGLRAADIFPTKPVRIISSYAAGGGPDVQLRQMARPLGDVLGQSIVVENRINHYRNQFQDGGHKGVLLGFASEASKPSAGKF